MHPSPSVPGGRSGTVRGYAKRNLRLTNIPHGFVKQNFTLPQKEQLYKKPKKIIVHTVNVRRAIFFIGQKGEQHGRDF